MKIEFPKNCSECPVFASSLFKDLKQDLIDWLAERKQLLRLEKKQELFHQNETVQGIFCHLDGLAKVVQKDSSNNIRFTRLVLPGDTSGHRSLFIENSYKGTAVVVSETLKACFISKVDILFLLSNNASLAKNLIVKISNELTRAEDQVISVKERNVRSRLAYLLYNLSNDYSDVYNQTQTILKSEITKKDIANLLMVADETIIRLMTEMRNEGLISYEHKRIV
ncbi:MAG: Crp/Fnr family transcriptional regulator, partial [Gammaproteobacteria bacterium]|nr:Crp/Fnr family transcriptional regulator [Gammaproteobacteria bacterium]